MCGTVGRNLTILAILAAVSVGGPTLMAQVEYADPPVETLRLVGPTSTSFDVVFVNGGNRRIQEYSRDVQRELGFLRLILSRTRPGGSWERTNVYRVNNLTGGSRPWDVAVAAPADLVISITGPGRWAGSATGSSSWPGGFVWINQLYIGGPVLFHELKHISGSFDPDHRTIRNPLVALGLTVKGFTQLPNAPSGLSAALADPVQDGVVLSWTDASDNEHAFRVERSTDGVTYVPLAEVGTDNGSRQREGPRGRWSTSGTLTFQDRSVTPGATYFYRVAAIGAVGLSEYSGTASITTPAP